VLGISLGCIIFFARIDYHRYKHYSKLLYIVGIGALLLVLAVGVKTKGAARWIDLGGLSIQPSEYAKYALVIFMSTWLSDNFNKLHDFKKGLLPVLAAGGLVIGIDSIATELFIGNGDFHHHAMHVVRGKCKNAVFPYDIWNWYFSFLAFMVFQLLIA